LYLGDIVIPRYLLSKDIFEDCSIFVGHTAFLMPAKCQSSESQNVWRKKEILYDSEIILTDVPVATVGY